MRILVTGGTGFLASHLMPALQKRGHIVSALVLPGSETRELERAGVEVHTGDVRELEALAPVMRGADAVFHLAAAIGVRRPISDYHAINVAGTENVCLAAITASVQRVVHVSTTSVYKQGLGVPAREDFPLMPLPDPYPRTKAAGDTLVQRMIATQQLPASIARICTVFGPGDRLNFGRIADRLLAGKGIVIGSGMNRVPFAYVDDVVQGLILVLEHEQAEGQIYNIADDRPLTQSELIQAIADQLGTSMPHIHVPFAALYNAAFAAECVAKFTHNPQALVTRFGVTLYGGDNCVSIDKARHDLGYAPQVPLSQGVSLAAAWYRDVHGAQGPDGYEARHLSGVSR